MHRLILIIVSAFLCISTPGFAKGDAGGAWKVSQRSGDAQVLRTGLKPVALQADAALAPGDVIMTGLTGRATLVRGADYIVVAPKSRLQLPKVEKPGGFTQIIQQWGTLLFKVRHTGIPHFEVETPMLAAVVKGTTFTVVVGEDRSAVQVVEGAVEVTAAVGGMNRLVTPGDTVFINRDAPATLILASGKTIEGGERNGVSAVRIDASADEPLTTVADLTAGLVRAEPPAAHEAAPAPVQLAALAPAPAPSAADPGTGGQAGSGVSPPATAAAPVLAAPAVVAPAVTAPAVTAPAVTTPAVTAPAVTTPAITTPAVTVPAVTVPAVTVPAITTPVITTPAITVPAVTVPAITVPVITVPAITVPAITTPVITTPAITVPAITTPVITTPVITVPAVTVPAITVPAVTVPAITVPAITVPAITVPAITVPAITVPAVTLPPVVIPPVVLPPVILPPLRLPLFGR